MMDIGALLTPRPAPTILFEAAARHGDKPRFHKPEPVSWNQYAAMVRNLGCCLLSRGVAKGESVAMYARNSVEWAAACLAIQSIGAVLVPIYPASTPAQRDYVLEHSDTRIYFDADGLLAVGGSRIASWSEAQEQEQERRAEFDERLANLKLEETGLMLYTSGTTGLPKGVPLTHGNVSQNSVDWLRCNEQSLHEDAVDLLWLPMSHIFGFGELCLGNALGFESHLLAPQQVLAAMADLSPTVFMSVPAYWEKLASQAHLSSDPVAELRKLTGGRLRFCLSGGAGLAREVKELFLEMGCLIIEGYGLTECAPTLTLNRPNDYRLDSVGKALPSVDLRVAADQEIQARGPNIFAGYYKDPRATAEAFTDDGWFRTGDVGTFDSDGFLKIIGRKKEILVTAGGKNIPPTNIEMQFQDDPFMDHVVVYGDGKKYLVAAIWPNRPNIESSLGQGATQSAVEALLETRVREVNQSLARFETIKKFAIIDTPLSVESELLTASLKIRRNKIYEHHKSTFESLYEAKPEQRA
ncbi:MAG: long-chain fatty acid--CoA ligase [Myxococcales bacterium]|nr:long-chain fatty acid--CoA ligase [Myxococcales bacterium]